MGKATVGCYRPLVLCRALWIFFECVVSLSVARLSVCLLRVRACVFCVCAWCECFWEWNLHIGSGIPCFCRRPHDLTPTACHCVCMLTHRASATYIRLGTRDLSPAGQRSQIQEAVITPIQAADTQSLETGPCSSQRGPNLFRCRCELLFFLR
jgi:hypothetical protein